MQVKELVYCITINTCIFFRVEAWGEGVNGLNKYLAWDCII